MQKLTSKQIIEAVKRNILLLLIPAILLAGLSFFFTVVKSGSYEANSVLIVTSNTEEPITYNKLILNEKLSNIYGQFLESNDLYEKVASEISPDMKASEIENNLEYTVNPQGGVIAFTYKDSNEARAKDSLTLITEEFRNFAKDYLNMENIEYLQNVLVKKSSNTRNLIFTIAAFIVGGLLGLVIIIIKKILSDRINDANDIRELDIEVLADLSKERSGELAKIKRKIDNISLENIIGFTPLKVSNNQLDISNDLANILDAKVIDARIHRENFADFESEMAEKLKDYRNVIFEEKSANDPISINLAKFEDYKILLVDKNSHKNELLGQVDEYKRLGIKLLGVIYY
ncbi:Wzz/FepE/Etk N-terminal domain-containing protein [Anaerococcus urinomassiliensis]|uniref:Wzz/FepE/Etk N-terminal domain-containing protein n=1 Tax=Anaerococcus urinomassiliensis TaxID=1745712 RepID=UPI00093AC624|nr:Wzz/FepE/Etk N-terminal domain-containing protein [Anaerococcus urinomassiliensis]